MLVQPMISLKLTLTIMVSLSNFEVKLIRNSGATVMVESILKTAKKAPQKRQALGYL